MTILLPPKVEAVFREFRTCEFTTLGRNGAPVTWPTAARYYPDKSRFLITSSIALPQKVYNVRRNPHVALLFSNQTGSGLVSPPAVLVQGDATAPDEVVTSVEGLEDYWRDTIFRRQPGSEMPDNAIVHKLADWYYMRILIWITPRTIRWWPDGDFARPSSSLEVSHVE
jgi:hypothetical protein